MSKARARTALIWLAAAMLAAAIVVLLIWAWSDPTWDWERKLGVTTLTVGILALLGVGYLSVEDENE